MKLLVDNRERHLIELLIDVCEEVTFVQLPIGDYVVISDSARAHDIHEKNKGRYMGTHLKIE